MPEMSKESKTELARWAGWAAVGQQQKEVHECSTAARIS
jgi:hypothetical protein